MSHIRTKEVLRCPVCTTEGNILYTNWTDVIFNFPGTWTWRQCSKKTCRTIWQDPCPIEEDLPKLYEQYPTHKAYTHIPPKNSIGQKIRNIVRSSYLSIAYGYPSKIPFVLKIFFFLFAHIHPWWKDNQASSVFYLPFKKNGVVLDIGCGNGSSLHSLENKGWKGIGIDFDTAAVKSATSSGIEAYSGDLSSQSFKDETFDAIIMSHVIEHLPFPQETLKECRRILKKNGVFVSLTPNANSSGRTTYQKNWRGFEPDHLQLFTLESLRQLGKQSGFSKVQAFSSLQGTEYILNSSRNILLGNEVDFVEKKNFFSIFQKHILQFALGIRHLYKQEADEVIVLRCYK